MQEDYTRHSKQASRTHDHGKVSAVILWNGKTSLEPIADSLLLKYKKIQFVSALNTQVCIECLAKHPTRSFSLFDVCDCLMFVHQVLASNESRHGSN